MDESGSELTAHLTTGAVAVYLIQWLKRQGWCPWLDEHTGVANRIVSLGAAVIAVMGISFTYDPSVGGDIHIPALSVLINGAWEVAKQFTTQQILYDSVLAPRALKGGVVQGVFPASPKDVTDRGLGHAEVQREV